MSKILKTPNYAASELKSYVVTGAAGELIIQAYSVEDAQTKYAELTKAEPVINQEEK
jgi:hypothetical protein